MKVYIIPTKNIMTTSFYYSLLEKVFKAAGFSVIMCDEKKRFHPEKKNDIIVSGNAYTTVKLWVKGYRLICTWFQGVEPEERMMQGCSSFKVFLHRILEYISLRKSTFIFLVSNAMKMHYEQQYGLRIDDSKCAIIPCFNEQKPFENCFLQSSKVPYSFVYSGGMGVWQCFEQTLEVYGLLKKLIPNATLSIYTYQVDLAQSIVQKKGIKDVVVQYIPKEKMNEALMNKMYGFVLREDNIVNRVATPTKLSNYIANGVIPICSSVVEDFSKVTNTFKHVIHVSSNDTASIVDEVYKKVMTITQSYSAKNHLQESQLLFDTYYSEKNYIDIVSKKIQQVITPYD